MAKQNADSNDGKQRYPCVYCSETLNFAHRSGLSRQITRKHSDEQDDSGNILCPECTGTSQLR